VGRRRGGQEGSEESPGGLREEPVEFVGGRGAGAPAPSPPLGLSPRNPYGLRAKSGAGAGATGGDGAGGLAGAQAGGPCWAPLGQAPEIIGALTELGLCSGVPGYPTWHGVYLLTQSSSAGPLPYRFGGLPRIR
jgi:hypothetical protein